MNEIFGRTDSILSVRASLIEIVAVAVVVGLGVNLLAAGIVARFGWSGAMTILLGAVLVLGGCGYLWWRASPRINKKLVFEGVFVVTRRNNEVVSIDRYNFAESMAGYVRALSAENRALGRAWADSSLRGFELENNGRVRRAVSAAAKLTQEAIEYYVLNKLSLHLSGHFENNPRVNDDEVIRIGRREIPSVLLDNRFLELFSKSMDEREAFTPACNRGESSESTVYATSEDGAIFDRFELILPAGAVVSRVSPESVRVYTPRLSMQISVGFQGFSAVPPSHFEELYLRRNYKDVDAYTVGLDIDVKFAWWALFTAAGWEYYQWLYSFIDGLNAGFSFSHFLENIGWNTALTITMLERSGKTSTQSSDNTTG